MSQSEIFDKITKKYPNLNLLHSSGGLPDVKGIGTSDVDISFPQNSLDKNLLIPLFGAENCKLTEEGEGYLIISLLGYEREVNVYVSKRPENACIHRQHELWLNENCPDLVPQAYALKKFAGFSTEEAWAKVLGLEGDCYEKMMIFEIIQKQGISKSIEWRSFAAKTPR